MPLTWFLCAPVTETKTFPQKSYAKNVVHKVALHRDACREMQLIPAAPTILLLLSKGLRLTLSSCLDVNKRNGKDW